jgi:uncharacterized protein YciI
MTLKVAVFAVCAALFASPAAAQVRPTADSTYAVLLRLRWDLYAQWKETGKWPADTAANRALSGHSAYWDKLRGEGRAIMAGGMRGEYWDNVAMIIFRAQSESEAKQLVQQDPAVRAHVFQAQVRGFDVSWIKP